MYTILAGMDEYYSKNLASNVKRALNFNANKCEFNGGLVPLGYKVINKHFVINNEEAKIIKLIYEMYLKDFSLIDICIELNNKGYKTRKGKEFSKNSIYDILHNEKYTGTYIYNKGTHSKTRQLREDIIRIENAFDPIIPKEMFNAVQAKTKRAVPQSYNKENYLLSGLLYCGKCGCRYNGQTTHKYKNGKDYISSYYFCSHRDKLNKCNGRRVKRDVIEKVVVNGLIELILNNQTEKEILQKVQQKYNELKINNITLIADTSKELKTTEKEIEALITLYTQTQSTSVINKLKNLEIKKEELKDRLEYYNKITPKQLTSKDIKEVLKADLKTLRKNEVGVKQVLQKFIKKIVAEDNQIVVHYNLSSVLTTFAIDPSLPFIIKTIEI